MYKMNKMKRFLVLLAFAGTSLSAAAQDTIASGNCGASGSNLTYVVTAYLGDTSLRIEGTGNMASYANATAMPWYAFISKITAVAIGNGVATIGNYAFYGCIGLTNLNIPSSVTTIGTSAFRNCRLTSLVIPKNVTSIGNDAFYGNSTLKKLTIDSSGTSLSLYRTTFASGSSTYGGTFYNCPIDTVYWGRNLTVNNQYTSSYYSTFGTAVKEVIFTANITSIPNYTFRDCITLLSITIPNAVTSIGDYAFYGCTGFTSITIPPLVTSIGQYAFYNCAGITALSIPSLVTTIGASAFRNCRLTSLTIPKNVTSIGETAFYGNNTLTKLTIDSGSTSLSLYGRYINGSDWYGTFYGCPIDTVYWGRNLSVSYYYTTISNRRAAFGTEVKEVIFTNNITSIPNHTFRACTNLLSITMPNAVTSIGQYAFYGCTGLTSITIPPLVTSIGVAAFYNCTGITALSIPSLVATIGESAFCNCRLTSLTIPTNVTSIGNDAFYNNTTLTKVIIDDFNTSLSLYRITYGSSTYAGTFYGCPIDTVYLGRNLTASNYYSSVNYPIFGTAVRDVTFSVNVTAISNYAFSGCNSLSTITSNAIFPPALGTNAFQYVYVNIPVYIPCQSRNSYTYSPEWSTVFNNFIGLSDTTFYAAVRCGNLPYFDANFSGLTQSGVYYDTLRNINGCDSIIELTLSFYPNVPLTNYAASFCQGGIYTDNHFANLTQAGNYYDTLQNINGCDSVVCLTLSIYPNVPLTNYAASICQGNIYNDNHFTNLTAAGNYYDTLQNVNGCDSVVCLTLTVNSLPPVPIISQNDAVLTSSSATGNQWYLNDTLIVGATGQTYICTQNGQYTVTVTNTAGCSSTSAAVIVTISQQFIPVSNIADLPAEATVGTPLTLAGTVEPSNATNQTIVWNVVDAGGTGANIIGNNLFVTAAGTAVISASIANGTAAGTDYVQGFYIKVNQDSVGIKQLTIENGELKIYPNPVDEQLTIKNEELREGSIVEIFDVVGRRLNNYQFSIVNSQLNIDVSHLAAGMYFLKIGNKVARFVKE